MSSFWCADCEQMMALLASGAADSSLSVRIPTAAAVAALSEALRSPPPGQARSIGLKGAATSAHFHDCKSLMFKKNPPKP